MIHMRSTTYIPAIRSSSRIVKYQSTGSTLTLRFFQLVCPATIISHVASTEQILVIETRIVYHRNDNLSLYINTFVIVPAIFRRIDTEAYKNEIGIRNDHFLLTTMSPNHDIFREVQIHATLGSLYTDTILVRTGEGRDFSYRLEITSIVGRLQTQLLKFIGNVVDGLGFVNSQRLTTTKFIGRQSLDSFLEESNFLFILLVLCNGGHTE